MRESDNAEVDVREDCDEDLLDVGWNVDLYDANHESTDLIYEEQVGDISFTLKMSQVKISFSSVRLVLTKRIWMDEYEYEVVRFVL